MWFALNPHSQMAKMFGTCANICAEPECENFFRKLMCETRYALAYCKEDAPPTTTTIITIYWTEYPLFESTEVTVRMAFWV